MEMSLSLSADQRSEIEQGRLLTAVVGSSQLHCVVVRADLIEQYQYLSDATPDSAIQEVSASIASIDPDDWKSPQDWRSGAGKLTPKLLVAFLAVWTVAASVLVVINASKLSHAERKLAQAEIDHNDEMTAALHRLLRQFKKDHFKGTWIGAFHHWLPLAKRTEEQDGTIGYSWATKTRNNEGPGSCFIKVDRDERVIMTEAVFPEW